MSSIVANENKKLQQEVISHELRDQQQKLSGKQEDHKIKEAQDLLSNFQALLKEGHAPGTEVINEACLRCEKLLLEISTSAQIDPQTRKTLEDITLLIGSTKQLAIHRDLGDRLQRISEETAKLVACIGTQSSHLTPEARTASLEIVNIVNHWKPLCELIITSREFRMLILNSVKILRTVANRHKKPGLEKKVEQKFIEGEPTQQIAKDVAQETKETFKTPSGETQVQISDKEFDTLYQDFAHMLVCLAKNPTYRSGIDNVFALLDVLQHHLGDEVVDVPDSVALHAKRAQVETEQLITTFTGQRVFNNFISSLKALARQFNSEPKTKKYLGELKAFILDAKTADKLGEQETKHKIKKFAADAREIIDQFKYGDELEKFYDAVEEMGESIKKDEFITILRHHAGVVADDLSFVDNNGNVQLDTDLLGKIRTCLGPMLADCLKYIPVPRVEVDNENNHFWVDNIVLCGYDIIPDKIRVQMESDSSINVRDIQTDHSNTRLIITLSHIKTEVKNLEFYYHKKTFPQITEQGRATVRLPGDGATLIIKYYIQQSVGEVVPAFHKGRVDFQIHDFEIDFDKKTLDHDILVPLITSMFKNQLQRSIEYSVENNLGGLISGIGEKLTAALVEANKPMIAGMEKVRQVIKSSEVGQVYDNRKDKLDQ